MTLEESLAVIEKKLAEWGATGWIQVQRKTRNSVPRVEFTRQLPAFSRYLQYHLADEQAVSWPFMFLFGEYGGKSDTDGRRGGDLAFLVEFIRAWLVDLCPQAQIPVFE